MRAGIGTSLGLGIVAFGFLALALLWGGMILQNRHERELAEAALAGRTVTLARAIGDHSLRTFRWADHALSYLADEYLSRPDHFANTIRHFTQAGSDFPFQVRVIEASGLLVFADLDVPPVAVNMADRSYFQVLRAEATGSDRMVISEPVTSRVSRKPVLALARRLELGGAFAGVIVLSVELDFFTRFYHSLGMGDDTSVMLVGTDGIVRAHATGHDDIEPETGRQVAADLPFLAAGAAPDGTFASQGAAGTILTAYQRLGDYPMAVTVSQNLDSALAHDAGHRRFMYGVATLVGLAVSLFCVVLLLLVRRQSMANAELEQSRRALKAHAVELRRSNAELEAFAYAASHDLREPLRMVSSYLSLIERRLGGELGDDIREFLHFARDGAQRMDRLILDLLEYSRVGRSNQPSEEVPLSEVMQTVTLTLDPRMAEAGATIAVAPGLPVVHGHRDELTRLFQNLVANSIKYRCPDRPLNVAVTATARAGEAVVAISDNGIGIDAQHFERIFAIFQRLHPRGEQDGTGIGLALCRKIAEHHHGRIWLTSQPGVGTTFLVALPLAAPEGQAQALQNLRLAVRPPLQSGLASASPRET